MVDFLINFIIYLNIYIQFINLFAIHGDSEYGWVFQQKFNINKTL